MAGLPIRTDFGLLSHVGENVPAQGFHLDVRNNLRANLTSLAVDDANHRDFRVAIPVELWNTS